MAAVILEVVPKYPDDGNDKLIKRFLKKCKKENLHSVFMDKCPYCARFVKKSIKDRKAKLAHMRKYQIMRERGEID